MSKNLPIVTTTVHHFDDGQPGRQSGTAVTQEAPFAEKLRDMAGLLRLMDKHGDPRQSSEATAVLLDEAAYQIEQGERTYILAVEGRQIFRLHFGRLREGIQKAQMLVAEHLAHEGLSYPELTTLLTDLLAPRAPDDIVPPSPTLDEMDALRIVAGCAQQLADFVKRSVNVGPLTSSPRGEAYLWRALRAALANLP